MIIYSVLCDECGKQIVSDASTRAEAIKSVKTHDFLTADKRHFCTACAEKAGYLVKCHGEAHKNSWIDNCSICAPRWGLVPV